MSSISELLTICLAFVAFYISLKRLIYTTHRSAAIFCKLTMIGDRPLIQISVKNTGGRKFSVNHIRINLPIFTRKQIYRSPSATKRAIKKLEQINTSEKFFDYPSDDGMIGEIIQFPHSLDIDDTATCLIDPELMFKAKHEAWDGCSNKLEFWIMIKTLRCEAVLQDKTVSIPLDGDSKDFIWSRYKDDDRIYCRTLPENWT